MLFQCEWERENGKVSCWTPPSALLTCRSNSNGDVFPYLETDIKVGRDLIEIGPELGTVEIRVIAYGTEQRRAFVEKLAVFSQSLFCKCALEVVFKIDLSLPPFIGPRGSSKPDMWKNHFGKPSVMPGILGFNVSEYILS